ncbi:MAG: NINE protein [Cyanobacteriota bacterium]|nr:NINE protein [Cyanobacteriota bacterium]
MNSTPPPTGSEITRVDNARRSLAISYGLWCLSFVGICGIHRFYNRKLPTGLLWLFTFGLCGVGQLVDLLLIPRMVKEATPPGDSPAALPSLQEGALPPLDLLRERRREQELEPLSGVFVLRQGLVRRGLLIGGAILGASLGLCLLSFLWHQLLRARAAQLQVFEQEAKQLGEIVNTQGASLKALKGSNEQLVKRLTDVRSSSALLADFQLRVPEGVQLTNVRMVSPTEIGLKGWARDPVAFGRVNAMELVLRRSPLFLAKGVTIEKVERLPQRRLSIKVKTPKTIDPVPVNVDFPSAVRFEMKAALSPLAPDRLVPVMESLKAQGMVRRLELLQREGLLK